MRPFALVTTILIILLAAGVLALWQAEPAKALPEYAVQTSEPCASCHLSPSGGGPRGPRGQAWVGSGKPGAVPDLVQSLELLGIHLDVDESQFQAPSGAAPAPGPLPVNPLDARLLHQQLKNYRGN